MQYHRPNVMRHVPLVAGMRGVPREYLSGLGLVSYQTNDLSKLYGMQALQYGDDAYPGLADQLTAIYADRIALIPGVPDDWLAGVMQYHHKNGYILIPVPLPNPAFRPAFLADPTSETAKGWQQAALAVQSAIQKYGAKMAADGKAELDATYRAAWWADIYLKAAQALASPITGGAKVLEKAADYYKVPLMIGGALLVGYFLIKAKLTK